MRWSVFTAAWLAMIAGLVVVGFVTCSSLEKDALDSLPYDLPPSAVAAKVSGIRQRVWLAGLTLGGFASGIMFTLNYRLRRPLELMRRTAERLAREDLAGQQHVPTTTEISGLAGALDQMADQLEQRMGLFSRRGANKRQYWPAWSRASWRSTRKSA